MNAALLRTVFGAGCLSLAIVGSASAGGFARGTADTDILFEDGNFAMRAGVTYVSPRRKYSSFDAAPGLVGTSYTDDYVIPSAAVKINLTNDFRCAGTLVDNNGGSASYAVPKPSGKLAEDFDTNEKALTCGMRFQAGPGYMWVLGGGFVEDFNYSRVNEYAIGPITLPHANLQLQGQQYGYRLGLAYEIPEIALRGQVLYRSGTSYGAGGRLTIPTAAVDGAEAKYYEALYLKAVAENNGANQALYGGLAMQKKQDAIAAAAAGTMTDFDATGTGNLPQTVEVKLQSGIAPGWLAFGSVKWADWSVQKELLVETANPLIGSADIYNWKDGWTVTGGIGHAFNENVSGALSLTWDRGVATGWDLSSDTYTLAAGGVLKDKFGGELRAGVGVSYLTSARETQYLNADVPGNPHSGFNSAVDAGWAFAVNLGYKVAW
ncbi:aromatic hydrocarbon degradation protein [Pseudaminobacter soli (ex Li et al. 2025)]|uniref:Aromatic hydrocarbon degradation protein n=1 Tax=Pseudaminobacter soli (ex Li et al. 2025) TaxID=1295366 RepID=A0A2P7S7Y7_9HYPH|nr:aromatic hydrocarbon degradation protein [Mesorhizobium soli]PSJ58599.1 aromatic hydrocarbon degradation protein [Mesorhizobium soli]